MAAKMMYPSLKDVQYLYSNYATIENDNVLYNNLTKVLDASFLSSLHYQNIHEAYNKILLKYYPNEICIKSNFINKVLLKSRNHITIFELPVGSSRVDLCKVNGKSTAYEIKTDLDNFSRLQKQLTDYFEIFDEVFVICSENNLKEISNRIPDASGIYTYIRTNHGTYKFHLIKNAQPGMSINSYKQLQLLRRKELSDYFNLCECTDRAQTSEIIPDILSRYSAASINDIFKQILKDRYKNRWNFLKQNHTKIYEIDYQWFFKNQINPEKIYQ